jgi:hypothetical protein
MATDGLSLVGFMEQDKASRYLANVCIPPNATPAALHTEWTTARAKLGPTVPNPGGRQSEQDADHHPPRRRHDL